MGDTGTKTEIDTMLTITDHDIFFECPACGKSISSQSSASPHCGFQRGAANDEELHALQVRRARDRVYRLNMASYAVITVFVAAFGWYWWITAGFRQPSPPGPFILMGIAGVAYLAVRVMAFLARAKFRKLRRAVR